MIRQELLQEGLGVVGRLLHCDQLRFAVQKVDASSHGLTCLAFRGGCPVGFVSKVRRSRTSGRRSGFEARSSLTIASVMASCISGHLASSLLQPPTVTV